MENIKNKKCFNKKCYNKNGAQQMVNLKKKRQGVKLRIYHCELCNFWHLSKSL